MDYIIVGLGNPGKEYEKTRHNAGRIAIDRIAEKYGIKINKIKFKGLYGQTDIAGKKVLLLKPETYMNLSGISVSEAADFYKVPAEHIIVLCDDISLPTAKLRIRREGSAGGHNGLKSIIAMLGCDSFPRIKIGTGNKPHPDYDLADWVLGRYGKEDFEKLSAALDHAADAAELVISGQIEEAMNRFNRQG